jgi:quercetin dioxygenase-like cupin family protein
MIEIALSTATLRRPFLAFLPHGASVHEHAHAQEEVWVILAGELEVTIDGVTQIAVPGVVAIVPPNVVHSVKALRAGKAIVVDYPLRPNI